MSEERFRIRIRLGSTEPRQAPVILPPDPAPPDQPPAPVLPALALTGRAGRLILEGSSAGPLTLETP